MDDNDLDLQPMDRGRLRPVLIGAALLVAGATAAVYVQKRLSAGTRQEQLARAADAWNELRFCLVGDALRQNQRPTSVVRLTELAVPRTLRIAPPAERVREWPYRCATHASVMTHALFQSGADEDAYKMLGMLVSRAADALEEGQLRTGEHERYAYLDELFEVIRRTELPAGAPPHGPPPPAPAPAPLRPRALPPVVTGVDAGELVSTDPTPARALRVVLGRGARRLCTFYPDADAARSLASFRCGPVPFADAPNEVELIGSADDAPAGLRVRVPGASESSLFVASGSSATLHRGGIGGFAPGATSVWTLERNAAGAWSLTLLGAPAGDGAGGNRSWPLALPLPDAARLAGPAMVWDRVLAAGPAREALDVDAGSAGDAGDAAVDVVVDAGDASDAGDAGDAGDAAGPTATLFATAAGEPTGHMPAFEPVGTMPAPGHGAGFQACRAGDALAVVARADDDHVAVSFWSAGHWSVPVAADARPAVLTCRRGEATLTWTETRPDRKIHQLRCTPERCDATAGPFPQYEPEAVVADLDGRVLMVGAPGPAHGLWFRLASLREIAEAPDVVAIDDAEHGGAAFDRPRVFVRDGTAVVLATGTAGERPTFAVRIDAQGRFSAASPAPGAPR